MSFHDGFITNREFILMETIELSTFSGTADEFNVQCINLRKEWLMHNNTEMTRLGTTFYNPGFGYKVYTQRGWVIVDTDKELQEELNDIESLLSSLPNKLQCSIGCL